MSIGMHPDEDDFLCRLCGHDLAPGHERYIGICTRCVADSTHRPQRVSISSPSYRPGHGKKEKLPQPE